VGTKASLRRGGKLGGELGHANDQLLAQQHKNRQHHHHNVRRHRDQLGKFYSHAHHTGFSPISGMVTTTGREQLAAGFS